MSGFRPFEAAISADLARAWRLRDYLSAFDPRVLSIPAPPAGATPEPPADEVQAGEPGPATADGTAPGAEQGEADPAVEHTTDAGSPMAPCRQPEAHGVWEDARGPLPAECDVPEHHEDAPDGEPQP